MIKLRPITPVGKLSSYVPMPGTDIEANNL